jgi:hypothetical protein
MYLRNQECRVRYYPGNFLDTNYTYYSQKCWNFPKQRNSNKKSIALIFRDVELVMVIWYFMQMSSILCMFEETKNCQVFNMFVLKTKNVRYIPHILRNQECSSIFYVYLREHKMSSTLCVYSRTHDCWVFFMYILTKHKMCNTFCIFKKPQMWSIFRERQILIHIQENTKCWILYISIQWMLSILCKCEVSHAYLRNQNSKHLNAYLRKQKMSNSLSILKKPHMSSICWECQVLLCIFEDPWM